ncbi:MAG: hypothetical protein KatS3mg060_2309 [Dehalococcoidia bacterium]|nr:MAG: hypothetical protein KatS3mg060_2309 [Dehalococcoidia bacterium]
MNFWATWCPPCRVEMSELDAYQAELGDRIVVLGVDMAEPEPVVAAFVGEYGLRFPILIGRHRRHRGHLWRRRPADDRHR